MLWQCGVAYPFALRFAFANARCSMRTKADSVVDPVCGVGVKRAAPELVADQEHLAVLFGQRQARRVDAADRLRYALLDVASCEQNFVRPVSNSEVQSFVCKQQVQSCEARSPTAHSSWSVQIAFGQRLDSSRLAESILLNDCGSLSHSFVVVCKYVSSTDFGCAMQVSYLGKAYKCAVQVYAG